MPFDYSLASPHIFQDSFSLTALAAKTGKQWGLPSGSGACFAASGACLRVLGPCGSLAAEHGPTAKLFVWWSSSRSKSKISFAKDGIARRTSHCVAFLNLSQSLFLPVCTAEELGKTITPTTTRSPLKK